MYGRLCIKFPQSRMKGEQHHARPTEPLVYTTTQWLWSLLMGMFSVCKHNGFHAIPFVLVDQTFCGGCCGRDRMVVGFITTYAISDLRQVSGFLRMLRFPPPIKLTTTI